jgi:DNA topoisomerase-3
MEIVAKQTTPPAYYTDAELIQSMQHAGKFVDDEKMKEVLDDAKGIGTSATRASIIDDLIKKEFLYRNKKTIRATEFGIATIKSLEGKNVISPALTAEWEAKLQDIEQGNATMGTFKKEMHQYIDTEVASHLSLNKVSYVSTSDKEVLGKCPKCGKDVIMTSKYVMCSTYKNTATGNCDFITGIVIAGTKVPKTEFKKLLSGKPTKKMKFTSAKTGKPFEAVLILKDNKIQFSFE